MKSHTSSLSNPVPAMRRLFMLCGLSTSPRRKATPPPIYLRTENQIPQSTVNELLKPEPASTKDVPLNPVLSFPVVASQASLRVPLNASGLISGVWSWIRTRKMARFGPRRLQVAEIVSLGEKRFVAVIQVDGLQYLIGGGPTNVALLAEMNVKKSFGDLLKETVGIPQERIATLATEQMREQA
jgi:Flagellar biosynthesis protein, FliO